MKTLLINGSPHKLGCTYTALSIVAEELQKNEINTEIFHIGNDAIKGCQGCAGCQKNDAHKCVFDNDCVNEAIIKAKESDGLIVGSPVHYASATGSVISFLDRFFYASGSFVAHKPCASIVSCRRAGSTATFDQLNKYFAIAQMPIVTSNYWNMVHGNKPEDVLKDEEGVQTLRILARNMAWILKCLEAGRKSGINLPELEKKIKTNFIR